MTSGRSDIDTFKLKVNRRDIAEIVENSRQLRITDIEFLRAAPLDDVQVAYTLLAFKDFLASRRCELPYELVLSE